jgi:hypothetical protein
MVAEPLAISPHFTTAHFTGPLNTDQKIQLFADRVRGWQLDIAQSLDAHPHSGFAVLSIVASYFEMIAKYEDGYLDRHRSEEYFNRGVRSVLEPHIQPEGSTISDETLHILYDEVRCGMYHAGMTGPRVVITRNPAVGIMREDHGHLVINPYALVEVVQTHFSNYVVSLNDPTNADLRENFERRFDAGHIGKRMYE